MKKKKQRQHVLHQATRKTSSFLSISATVDGLKRLIITFSVWGWLPLGLANWILNKEKAREAFKFQAGSKPSKKVV